MLMFFCRRIASQSPSIQFHWRDEALTALRQGGKGNHALLQLRNELPISSACNSKPDTCHPSLCLAQESSELLRRTTAEISPQCKADPTGLRFGAFAV